MYWEALEKPVFAGWDVHVTLSPSGMRRRDAGELLGVLDILQASRPVFWRNARYVRAVRRGKYLYKDVEREFYANKWGLYHSSGRLFSRSIDERTYDGLSGTYKKYFEKQRVSGNFWRPDYWEYHLKWEFPTYELIVKVQKSYNTFIGHLYGDEIGEYNKLHQWLWHEAQAPTRKRLGWNIGYRRDSFHRGIKTRWAAACKELIRIPLQNSQEWGAYEFEDYIDRRYHLHDKKKYGWS
jgi:hypothetical protein